MSWCLFQPIDWLFYTQVAKTIFGEVCPSFLLRIPEVNQYKYPARDNLWESRFEMSSRCKTTSSWQSLRVEAWRYHLCDWRSTCYVNPLATLWALYCSKVPSMRFTLNIHLHPTIFFPSGRKPNIPSIKTFLKSYSSSTALHHCKRSECPLRIMDKKLWF